MVGRLRKPHGLKGECAVFPLTDDPDAVFAPGRAVLAGGSEREVVAGPLVIERSRAYHREWLVKFAGADQRDALDAVAGRCSWRCRRRSCTPPEEGEVYLHELDGFAVRLDRMRRRSAW